MTRQFKNIFFKIGDSHKTVLKIMAEATTDPKNALPLVGAFVGKMRYPIYFLQN